MICPKCQTRNPDNNLNCINCGSLLSVPLQQKPDTPINPQQQIKHVSIISLNRLIIVTSIILFVLLVSTILLNNKKNVVSPKNATAIPPSTLSLNTKIETVYAAGNEEVIEDFLPAQNKILITHWRPTSGDSDPDFIPKIWSMDLVAGRKDEIYSGDKGYVDIGAKWSPLGDKIAFVSAKKVISAPGLPEVKIHIIGADGTGDKIVYGNIGEEKDNWYHSFSWSNDGKYIALAVNDGVIWLINITDGTKKKITDNAKVSYGAGIYPRFSPDNGLLAFPGVANPATSSGEMAMWLYDLNSNTVRKAVDKLYPSETELDPVWNSNGNKLLILGSAAPYNTNNLKTFISIINISSSQETPLDIGNQTFSSDWFPAYSSSDDSLAIIVIGTNKKSQIMIVNPDGSIKNIGIIPDDTGYLVWGSDKKTIFARGGKSITKITDFNN